MGRQGPVEFGNRQQASPTNLYNALGQLAQYSTTLPSSFSSPLIYNPAGEWIGQINNSSYWWGQYVPG